MPPPPQITDESDFGVPEMSAILEQDEFTDGTISTEERDDWIKDFVDEFKEGREEVLIDNFWEQFSIRMDEMRAKKKAEEMEKKEKERVAKLLGNVLEEK